MDFTTAACLFWMLVGVGVSFYPVWIKYLELRKLRAEDEVEKHRP